MEMRRSENPDLLQFDEDSETVLIDAQDAETVLNDREDSRNRTSYAEGFNLLNAELYKLSDKYGSRNRVFDDIRRELINVLRETDKPDYRSEESRKALLDAAVRRAEAPRSIEEMKTVMDDYIEELFDMFSVDLTDTDRIMMVDLLKRDEYWNRSKADIRMDFDQRLAEWIRRGRFKDQIKKTEPYESQEDEPIKKAA